MAVDMISVQTEALQRDKNTIAEDLSAIRQNVKGMYEQAEQLNSMWEGQANAAFAAQFQSDYLRAGELCDAIAEFIGQLEYAVSGYNTCESQVADIVSAIKI